MELAIWIELAVWMALAVWIKWLLGFSGEFDRRLCETP